MAKATTISKPDVLKTIGAARAAIEACRRELDRRFERSLGYLADVEVWANNGPKPDAAIEVRRLSTLLAGHPPGQHGDDCECKLCVAEAAYCERFAAAIEIEEVATALLHIAAAKDPGNLDDYAQALDYIEYTVQETFRTRWIADEVNDAWKARVNAAPAADATGETNAA